MFIRLPLLLIFLLSLAIGPVKLSAACLFQEEKAACGSCCADPEMACCAATDDGSPAKPPASVVPQSPDAKLIPPTFVFVGFCPLPVVERPSYYQRQAARMPVPPRLDLTCIRLI